MTPTRLIDTSSWQPLERIYSFARTSGVWHQAPGTSWRTSEELLQERQYNPWTILISVLYTIPDMLAVYMDFPEIFQHMIHFDQISTQRSDIAQSTIVRGDMNRQGTITEAGVSAFENDGEIQGSLAVSTHIAVDNLVRLDLRIVSDAGETLVEWEGVDVIDGSQVTWCFSDTGNIRITMDPIIGQETEEARS